MEDGQLENLTNDDPLPLVIKIDLGDGNFANINCAKNSNPLELATKFCQEQQLPDSIIGPLCNRIQANIESHYVRRSEG